MPVWTKYSPAHQGEKRFWNTLLSLDDGTLHLWHSLTPPKGTEIDVLLVDMESGAYCIEVKGLSFTGIRNLDLQSMERADGSVGPSPFLQALNAARSLGGFLDRSWGERPYLVPVAAFPLISRIEWDQFFKDSPLDSRSCLLSDDLQSLITLRQRLSYIALHPLAGLPRREPQATLANDAYEKINTIIFGTAVPDQSTSIVPVAQRTSNPITPLLEATIALVKGQGAFYGSPGLAALQKWSVALSESSGRLRASVVGDFKAGKSSLINAILRREVCFVDDFEATGIRALYCDGVSEGAELTYTNGRKEFVKITEFVDRCARRETQGIEFATVTLRTGLPFDIADSPGLGTQTLANAGQAEEEIRRTDLLLFAVDCADPGGAKESTLIARAREVGLPVIVLLTKSDMLDNQDVTQLRDYIFEETGTPLNDIIPVSSKNYSIKDDTGIETLISRLVDSARKHEQNRLVVEAAKVREVGDAITTVLRNLLHLNQPHLKFVMSERGYLEASSKDVVRSAKAEWLQVLRAECANVISSEAIQSASSPQEAEQRLKLAIPDAINRACKRLSKNLHMHIRDEWREALNERALDFEKRITLLATSRPDAVADLSFLRAEKNAFIQRADIVTEESDSFANEQRQWMAGIGAVASVLTSSFLPLAIGALAAAFLVSGSKSREVGARRLDPALNAKLEQHLVEAFDNITPQIEQAIDRMIAEVAIRSLEKIVATKGGPSLEVIVQIDRQCNDLIDEVGVALQ